MIIKIATCFLAVAFLAGCESTKTTKRETIREMTARYAANNATDVGEPPAPAEGPEDVPGEGPTDLKRNPALVPSPLLRMNAAGSP
ncbi:MAG TPA: hypothetical protein VGI42_08055 [Chthoniobacterales bacterium]